MDDEAAALVIRPPEGRSREVKVSRGPFTIGRGLQNDLTLPDLLASRAHAEIAWRGDSPWIRDLDSENGVRIAGIRIRELPLRSGDSVVIGSTRLDYSGPGCAPVRRWMRRLADDVRFAWGRIAPTGSLAMQALEEGELRALEDLGRVVLALDVQPPDRPFDSELEAARDALRPVHGAEASEREAAERLVILRFVQLGWRAAGRMGPDPKLDDVLARADGAPVATRLIRHAVDVATLLRGTSARSS